MTRRTLIAALGVAVGCAFPAGASAWVTAWQAPANGGSGIYFQTAPNPLTASFPQGFSDQTLRLVVTPHAAGTRARIVLSNLYGQRPLHVTAATIALRATGAALASPAIPLTFSGRRSLTLARGAESVSDPAEITVEPFQDLAISLAVGGSTGPPTNHVNGLQTSFVAPPGSGDLTGAREPGAFTAATPMRFFVTGLHVEGGAAARTLVAVGDSITDGGVYAPDTADRNARWPDHLQRRLLAEGSYLSVANAGISANQVTKDESLIPGGGPSVERRLDRDVLRQPGLAGVIVAAGINDLQITRTPAADLIAGLTRVARRVRAQGLPVFIATLTPVKGDAFDAPDLQRARTAVNAWIRSQDVSSGVIDFDAAVRDPTDPDRLRSDLDSGDRLHPNAKGLEAMAHAVDLTALRSALGDAPPRARPRLALRRIGCTAVRLTLSDVAGTRLRIRLGRRTVARTARRATVRLTLRRVPRSRLTVQVTVVRPGNAQVVLTRPLAACRSTSTGGPARSPR